MDDWDHDPLKILAHWTHILQYNHRHELLPTSAHVSDHAVSATSLSRLVRQLARDEASPLGHTDGGHALGEGEAVVCYGRRHAHEVDVLPLLVAAVFNIPLI